MSFDEFAARLEALGATFQSIVMTDGNEHRTVYYFTRSGRTAAVDLGDISYLTQSTIERVCRKLALSVDAVTNKCN